MHHTDNRTVIFGHSVQHIPIRVFVVKEYLDLLIEEKWRKQEDFAAFISSIEKLPSPNEKNCTLHQGNDCIDVYKNFFDKQYERCIKELLPLSMSCKPATASTFAQWYLGATEPNEKELNIGMCEVHKFNVSTTRWRDFLDSLTINPKDFDGDPIVYHKSEMGQLSKGSYIWNSDVNEDLVKLQNYCEEFVFPLKHHTQST